MQKRVYIESTVVSYIAALPSRDLVKAARQDISWEWWNTRREQFDVYISDTVIEEISRGDAEAADRRLSLIAGISVLEVTLEAETLAASFLEDGVIPANAVADALHLSVAVVNKIDFLLTWNCRHLANAELVRILQQYIEARGYFPPVICTPDELLEKTDEIR